MQSVILVAVEDLFFLARIQETARQVGVTVEPVSPAKLTADLEDRAGRASVGAVVLDLNCRSAYAVDLVRALKANRLTSGIPVLGFVSHVQSDLISAARAAGCDTVLARSAFTQHLPQLLSTMVGRERPAGTPT